MSFMKAGPASMLKDGASIVDDPVIKNIQACHDLSLTTRSSMGPYGLSKMVINHLNKLFVTHDTATILRELEVVHPAARLMVHAANAMQEEVGDGTNLVVALAGEFLAQAEVLVRTGLHPSDIVEGYKKASAKALELLEKLECGKVTDCHSVEAVLPPVQTAIASKQRGYEALLGKLVADACVNAYPSNGDSFNVDNVRIVKLEGDSVMGSSLIRGFVIPRSVEGSIKHAEGAKVAVYACAVDIPSTETKGNVLMETASDLLSYSAKEEDIMEGIIQKIADTGAKVVVANANFGDLALHFLNRFGIMAVKIHSKFEMRRLCAAVGAHPLAKMRTPTEEELGFCDNVDVKEMGSKPVLVFAQTREDSKLSTILVRGATTNVLDDVERALDDGINVFKALTRDPRLVAGGGAVEMEIQKELTSFAETNRGLDQYSMRKFAASFEIVARTLGEVSGYNGTDLVTLVEADHQAGKSHNGVDLETGTTQNSVDKGVVDPMLVKHWAIRLASDVALTVLQVDQIIVAKQAGGPKLNAERARDEE